MKARVAILLLLPLILQAQEPIYGRAATQPAVGLSYLRTRLIFHELGSSRTEKATDELILHAAYTYGLRYNVALHAATAWEHRKGGEEGLADLHLAAKWRILQRDTGPINTLRGSLLGGVEIPSGTSGISSDSTDPFIGAVITSISGRHGLNGDLHVQLNTGSGPDGADEFNYNGSWLYRLGPIEWQVDTKASYYTVLELNGRAFDDGDHELLLAPGLLYEARSWAVEIALHLPLFEDMEYQQPEDFGITTGARFLF